MALDVEDGQTITLTIKRRGVRTFVVANGSWRPASFPTIVGSRTISKKPRGVDTSSENTTKGEIAWPLKR
jgi:hypothetical protein